MPRRARLVLPGIPWHIIQRGNNRSACFYKNSDYTCYLNVLAEQAEKYDCLVHAWCLMTNHVHLLLTPARNDSAALLMKHLGQRYVQYVNRTYRRTGTLWEGRFRSCLVQQSRYVLACYRYIEMNPVRAGMVDHPARYRWSSYRINARNETVHWCTPHADYLALGADADSQQVNYRRLFVGQMDESLLDEIRGATNGNYALGNERFRVEVEMTLQRRAAPGKPGRPIKK